jgi:amidase
MIVSRTLKDGEKKMKDDFSDLDGIGQGALVRSGEVSAGELVEAAIRRIEKMDPVIHALASVDFDNARKKAETTGQGGLFRGVPFLIKDIISYPGLRHAMGSRLFAQNIAREATPFSERIDESGLIPLGKTTTSEFGLLGSTETLLCGKTHNPWNLEYSATGSSGGSAAAVASRMVPLAHAEDGGGSIRIPASACGLFGFKPSANRCVPAIPVQNDFVNLVSEHCVSHSVRDSAYFLSLTERKADDATLPPVGYVDRPIDRSLRIGFYKTILMGDLPEKEVLNALEHTARLCSELGHEIVEIPAPDLDGKAISDGFFTFAGAAMDGMARMMEGLIGSPVNDAHLEPFTLSLIKWYRSLPADALMRARSAFDNAAKIMANYMKKFDVVLCPTLARTPQKLGYLSPQLDRELLIRRTEQFAGYTPIHNIAGLPAMSVPLYITDTGLPVGSHFAAPVGCEATLFGLAYQLEEAAQWTRKRPKIVEGVVL